MIGRIGEVKRETKETNVFVKINLDGTGVAENSTGIPFLDHMLDVSLFVPCLRFFRMKDSNIPSFFIFNFIFFSLILNSTRIYVH